MRIRFSDLSCIDVVEIDLSSCWNPSTGEWNVYVEMSEGCDSESYAIGEMSHDMFSTREEAEIGGKKIIDTLFETGCIDFRHAEQDWGLELY